MRCGVRLTSSQLAQMKAHLFRGTDNEEAALLLAETVTWGDWSELLVRDVICVPPSGLTRQGPACLVISPEFMAPYIKRCRVEGLSLIDVHSHPGTGRVGFSGVDDNGDDELMPTIFRRAPGRKHANIVMNVDSLAARVWCPDMSLPLPVDRVVTVGMPMHMHTTGLRRHRAFDPEKYHRQILAYSEDGQQRLVDANVAVVGCGGLGSLAVQYLAYSGISGMVLIDPDTVETSNLSRIVGARPTDVGARKVDIARRTAQDANPDAEIVTYRGLVSDQPIRDHLLDVDVILCCTDTLGSRDFLNQLAVYYARPLIDAGIDVKPMKSGQLKVFGRVTPVLPGMSCLYCAGVITEEGLAEEQGKSERVPAMLSQNGVIASLAVNEVVNTIVGFGDPGCYGMGIEYQGHKGIVRRSQLHPGTVCPVCSATGGCADPSD